MVRDDSKTASAPSLARLQGSLIPAGRAAFRHLEFGLYLVQDGSRPYPISRLGNHGRQSARHYGRLLQDTLPEAEERRPARHPEVLPE